MSESSKQKMDNPNTPKLKLARFKLPEENNNESKKRILNTLMAVNNEQAHTKTVQKNPR